MLQATHYFLQFRGDLILLAIICTVACVLVRRAVRKRGEHCQLSPGVYWAIAALVLVGGAGAEWAAKERIGSLTKLFAAFGPTYATELEQHGHAKITFDTPADDPLYLEIIGHEKHWLAANPIVADIYTFRADREGRIRFVVDSETDYNHDGKYDEDREQRTPIGEIYPDPTPGFFSALLGETVFEPTVMPDRWGVWVSSFAPIHAPDGHVEAGVGIDYPAGTWLTAIASVRAACLAIALVLIAIILASSTFIAFLSAEIEERKLAQSRLELANEAAITASAAKSEFLALLSHEVRTPLSAILGFATILADTRLDPKQRRYVETINRAGGSLLTFLNGILDYTRVESGKLTLEQIAWAPALLVHEVMELMSVRASERDLQFSFDNRLPDELTLNGDPTRVRQIVLNLVANAIKFTPTGSVTVRAEWFPATGGTEHGEFVLQVIDTGIGIAPDKVPKLFQAFTQADASTTRRHGGTGLGLAIAKRLAESMQGELALESRLHAGSTFTFRLPSRSVGSIGPSVPTPSGIPVVPGWGRALVVDDTRLNRELLKVMLHRLGLDADVAPSGPEALRAAGEHTYTVILMDLEMPDMDGFATARAIRAAERPGQRVPIIAVSAMRTTGTREKCLEAGMDDYLTKPVYQPALKSLAESLRPGNRSSTTTPSVQPAAVT